MTSFLYYRFEEIYEKVKVEEPKVNFGISTFTNDKNKQESVIEALSSFERVFPGLKVDIERYIGKLIFFYIIDGV